jgi:hypothetical protein
VVVAVEFCDLVGERPRVPRLTHDSPLLLSERVSELGDRGFGELVMLEQLRISCSHRKECWADGASVL